MLSLNKYQYTKDGSKVMPLAISGDIVQCVDTNGVIIMKSIHDFDDNKEEKKPQEKIIEVSPIEEENTDFLIDKKEFEMVQYEGELFEKEEEVSEEQKSVVRVDKKSKPKTRYVSDEVYI